MPHCVAFDCNIQAKNNENDPKVRLHNFPNDAAIRRAWIHAVGRTSLPKDPRLCSKHFEEHCFEESYLMEVRLIGSSNSKKSLKPGAIPTLFLTNVRKVEAHQVFNVRRRQNARESDTRQVVLIKTIKHKYNSPLVENTQLYLNSSFITNFYFHKVVVVAIMINIVRNRQLF